MKRFLPVLFSTLLAIGCNVSDDPTIVAQTECIAPQTFCAELQTCEDLSTSQTSCGACGNACSVGEICADGACELACPEGTVACDGSCVNPLTNSAYCGAGEACEGGATCGDDEVCSAGACALFCADGLIQCDGRCIDPDVDPAFCGAEGNCSGQNAGDTCATNEVCDRGTCATGCSGNSVPCDGGCVDAQENPRFCGASGTCEGASAGTMCTGGEICAAGACVLSCADSLVACGTECIDPMSNPNHCGATNPCVDGEASAGTQCLANESCYAGSCFPNVATFVSPTNGRGTIGQRRDAIYSIASLIPGANVLYTTDGSEPSPGSTTTMTSAEYVNTMPLTANTRVQFRIEIDGRLSPVESFVHNTVDPDPAALIIENTSVDGAGPFARVEPGAMVSLDYLFEQYNNDATNTFVAVIYGPEFDVIRCETTSEAGPTQGTATSDTFTAPTEPGEYDISFRFISGGDCNALDEQTTPGTRMARIRVE